MRFRGVLHQSPRMEILLPYRTKIFRQQISHLQRKDRWWYTDPDSVEAAAAERPKINKFKSPQCFVSEKWVGQMKNTIVASANWMSNARFPSQKCNTLSCAELRRKKTMCFTVAPGNGENLHSSREVLQKAVKSIFGDALNMLSNGVWQQMHSKVCNPYNTLPEKSNTKTLRESV